jgi:TnpA family transposase
MPMPRQLILSATERQNLLALPDTTDELIRRYTLTEADLAVIRKHRGAANRLGFTIQLCHLRFPGIVLGVDEPPSSILLGLVAEQLKISADVGSSMASEPRHDANIFLSYKKYSGSRRLPRATIGKQ